LVEHKIKLEKSVKIILGVFAVGVFLTAFAPVFDVREASARFIDIGQQKYPVHIGCLKGCKQLLVNQYS
jgi:hypothetical protein